MKIYKRFKQWILVMKGKVPPKAAHFTDMGVKRVGKSTPTSQQQSAVKMLETPITPMSLSTCLLFDARLSILTRHPELRSTVPAAQPSPTKSVSPRRSPLSPNKHILNTPRCVLWPPSFHPARYLTQYSRIRSSSEGSPSTRHLKRTRDENEDTTVEEMSQTQEDSQGLLYLPVTHVISV